MQAVVMVLLRLFSEEESNLLHNKTSNLIVLPMET